MPIICAPGLEAYKLSVQIHTHWPIFLSVVKVGRENLSAPAALLQSASLQWLQSALFEEKDSLTGSTFEARQS